MNTVDYNFYRYPNEVAKPSYTWDGMVLNIGCYEKDLKLNGTEKITEEGKKNVSNLIHEYIHFLQNFCTAWGVPIFSDFALSYQKIGASIISSKEVFNYPFDFKKSTNKDLLEGIKLRETVISRFNKFGNVVVLDGNDKTEMRLEFSENGCTLSNNLLKVELGLKVIREHMAQIGTMLFFGFTDEQIHLENEKNSLDKDKTFSRNSEYWIVFEYVYGMNKYSNIGRGLFLLTQSCLVYLNPEMGIKRFFQWFHRSKCTCNSFIEVVQEWLKTEENYKKVGFEKSLEHCQKLLAMNEKHKDSENELFRTVYWILKYSVENLKKYCGGITLFELKDELKDFNYWKGKMATIGTGIVRYIDCTVIHGNKEHCAKMEQHLNIFLSCSLVLKHINATNKNCPFLDDIPICVSENRGIDKCYQNPFLIKDSNGKSCLFKAGSKLLGFDTKLKF